MGVIVISPVKKSASKETEGAKTKKSSAKKSTTTKKASPAKKSSAKKPKASKTISAEKGRVLVIVESPSKAATLSGMLGKGYVVRSSKGHMKDLPKSRLAIDIEHDFTPEYILVKGKAALKN
ncbi:MAG: DNA topoisomerase I, partial [Synergistaceae bacterium]|nr:DNA topoisomerase I [Synergistaceae bacterium]